tara:strand:+ start:624 stop:1550 length:927 start_codon:yes stop_codon:yes gene_type:complete
MRKAFANTLIKIAKKDKKIIFLTGDLGFGVFDEFKKKFPERYINVGVAESQMVSMAAGLALEGFKPIVYSIASFLLRRAYEQIRISVCYHNLPVIFIGAGGGFVYASSGPTHHSQEDFSLMSSIPNMMIIAPGSPDELTSLIPQAIKQKKPCYIRIGKFGEPNYDSIDQTYIKKIKKIKNGKEVFFLTNSDTVSLIIDVCKKLKNQNNIDVGILHAHTLKPIDDKNLKIKLRKIKKLIIVEESNVTGGLYSIISQLVSNKSLNLKVYRKGPVDEFILGNPSRDEIRFRYKYDEKNLIKFVKKVCKNEI